MSQFSEKQLRKRLDPICDEFEAAWLRGERPSLDDIVQQVEPEIHSQLFAELLGIELEFRGQAGEFPERDEYESRYPAFSAEIQATFREHCDRQQVTHRLSKSNADTDDIGGEDASGEAEFRKFLKPSKRTGWLGRLGHYEIETILGRGAFGIVAKALDEKLHRVVAIKLMSPNLAATSPPRQRFLREARSAAAVSHENIVAIYAVEEEPIPYLVMEYVPGQTLQQRMDAIGPLEAKDVLRIGQQVSAGMAAAHSAKLIHRDIKPSNILLTGGPVERAKISDFGMARAVDDASLTQSGVIGGTPLYMAPEQARGEVLDHRADLFSLGSVLYQMASGRPPFRAANSMAVLKRVCEDTPRPLNDVIPEIPGWLESIIFKLLEKKREDRYQSAQELADLLARCQWELEHNGHVTSVKANQSATDTQLLPSAEATDQKSRWKLVGWLIGGVLAVAAVISFSLMNDGTKTPDSDLSISSVVSPSPSSTEAPPRKSPESIGWQGSPPEDLVKLGVNALGPKIATDGLALWFHAPEDRESFGSRLILWQSWRQTTNEPFGAPIRVEDSINNQPEHNLTDVTLSADGLVLCFCRTKNGTDGNSDLWMSTRPSGDASWSEPISVGPGVNTKHGEWEPELSPNGLELFFHSSRPNENGSTDLWVSRRTNREAEFGFAENLGPAINTKDVEAGAALSGDGLTLLFHRFTSGEASLWHAARKSLDAPFESPQRLMISLPVDEQFICVSLSTSGEELYGLHRTNDRSVIGVSQLKPAVPAK